MQSLTLLRKRGITMSENIVRSIIRTATGHLRAGVLHFNAYGLDFTLEKLQRTAGTYAIMTNVGNSPLCVGHIA